MSVWLFFACLQDLLNSLAHKLPASTESFERGTGLFVLFGFVVALGFVCFAFGRTPLWIPDCVMVRAPLSTPQCGMLIHTLSNSFISTNTV